jgi:hypothetical protein
MRREELREMLEALRADHPMAASLAGSLKVLRDMRARAVAGPDSSSRVACAATRASGCANARAFRRATQCGTQIRCAVDDRQ